MLENVIQAAIGIVVLSVFSSVFANKELGNSTVPDAIVFNCSLDVQVGEFHSRIDLCSLKGNQIVSQKTSSGKNSPSINIYRYYRINPVGRIQAAANKRNLSELPDLSATNCPPYSTSCLVSHVTFQCNNNQDTNGVCHLNDQITADSYGYQRNWTPKAVYPPETSSGDLEGSTAFITMQGGPCYYCDNSKRKLSTVIGFYCDERITGKGKPIIRRNPTKSNPEVLFHWNTSAACYEFIPNEQCTFPDFFKIQCKQNSFRCGNSNHEYKLPLSANSSITKSINSRVNYTFGFCAGKVQCPTDNNVMICRTEGQESKALAYYSDSIDFVARPTGFVIQIRENLLGGSLKAVISFECSTSSSDMSMTVLENDTLPILLTLKHRCFCPNSQTCQSAEHTTTTTPSSGMQSAPIIVKTLVGVIVPLCTIAAIFLYVRQKLTRHARTREEVPPPNNNDGDSSGGHGNDL